MIVVFKIQFAINFFMADIIFNMTGIIQFIRDSPVYVIIIHFLNFDILMVGPMHSAWEPQESFILLETHQYLSSSFIFLMSY